MLSELGSPISVIDQKMNLRAIWWGHFLSVGSFFHDDPRLCQGNIELASTPVKATQWN